MKKAILFLIIASVACFAFADEVVSEEAPVVLEETTETAVTEIPEGYMLSETGELIPIPVEETEVAETAVVAE